jgi:hypothetical protein
MLPIMVFAYQPCISSAGHSGRAVMQEASTRENMSKVHHRRSRAGLLACVLLQLEKNNLLALG